MKIHDGLKTYLDEMFDETLAMILLRNRFYQNTVQNTKERILREREEVEYDPEYDEYYGCVPKKQELLEEKIRKEADLKIKKILARANLNVPFIKKMADEYLHQHFEEMLLNTAHRAIEEANTFMNY